MMPGLKLEPNVEQVQLRVSGMSCTGCEQRIQQALSRVGWRGPQRRGPPAGQVQVIFDPARTSEQSVRACIKQASYAVLP